MRYVLPLLFPAVFAAFAAAAQEPEAAPTLAPLVAQLARAEALPARPLQEAHRTLPQARQRYQRGLPAGTALYLTARVLNEAATPEPVVVRVDTWTGPRLTGRIVRLTAAGRPQAQAPVEFEEAAVLDWLLLHAGGAEEGNYLGRFLELEERLAALQD